MKLKEKSIQDFEKPRERLLKYGVSSLSNEELIAIILKTGTKEQSVKSVARTMLQQFTNMSDFRELSIHQLIKIHGIGYAKGLSLIAALEFGRRVYLEQEIKTLQFHNPTNIHSYFKSILHDKKQEYFYAVYLDNKKKLIEYKLLFIGTLNQSIVHPREIFKHAYLLSAASIICIHNHPSNDLTPSKEDILFTKSLSDIGKIQGIPLLDHIIIGSSGYYSFFEHNQMT